MVTRQRTTPCSLNATATHDTKRGEDVRIRLNVLSEIPDQWIRIVQHWFELNRHARVPVDGKPAPAVNDEYFIYQSILGGFPGDIQPSENWVARLQEYLVKAFREAKVNTGWESPEENYEMRQRVRDKIINHNNEFLNSLMQFLKDIMPHANTNAIGQMLIKITAPGIPDMYQGCELWDLSYVDPDNRRPVDYKSRKNYLTLIREKEKDNPAYLFSFLSDNRELGLEKLFVAWKALNFRRANSNFLAMVNTCPFRYQVDDPLRARTHAVMRTSGY